jgi:hypothetical protein
MPLLTDIADAVVTALNAGDFEPSFTAARAYLPRYELAQMGTLHVTVVPKAIEIAGGTRQANQYDCQVDVAVQQRLSNAGDAGAEAEQLDRLMGLAEQIADHFRLKRLADLPTAAWVRTENAPVYSPEHLEQLRQFTSVITLTFRVVR